MKIDEIDEKSEKKIFQKKSQKKELSKISR